MDERCEPSLQHGSSPVCLARSPSVPGTGRDIEGRGSEPRSRPSGSRAMSRDIARHIPPGPDDWTAQKSRAGKFGGAGPDVSRGKIVCAGQEVDDGDPVFAPTPSADTLRPGGLPQGAAPRSRSVGHRPGGRWPLPLSPCCPMRWTVGRCPAPPHWQHRAASPSRPSHSPPEDPAAWSSLRP
jgi:hypothetical protein